MINSVLKALWQEEEGQDLVEYALLIAFIALAAAAMLKSLGTGVSTMFSSISSTLSSAAS